MTEPEPIRFGPEPILFETDQQELNTILAALRLYQHEGYGNPTMRPDWLHEIVCPTDDDTSLDSEAIDALCERLNTA